MENGQLEEKIDQVLELAIAVRSAEATLAQLKGQLAAVLNIEHRPAKSAPIERLSLRANIRSYLAKHKGQTFTAAAIAKALNRDAKVVRVTLFQMQKAKEIKRPARGVFEAKAA